MGELLYTTVGHIDEELCERSVYTEEGPNYFKVYTRWTLKADLHIDGKLLAKSGEVMREDCAPSIKAGLNAVSIQGKMN